jgi:Flp pilus assembly protein TadG
VTILDLGFWICDYKARQTDAQSSIVNQQSSIDLRSRRGIAELLSTFVALPVLLLAIGVILFFGRAMYAQAAIEDAASVGARWAATSLSGQKGCQQAREAMNRVLQGYYVDPGGAQITVRPVSLWGRGTRARVQVQYTVGQGRVPILGALLGDTTVRTQYDVPIDTFINRYSYGWMSCGL